MDLLDAKARAEITRHFELKELLARGRCSLVYHAHRRGDGGGPGVAIKAIPCNPGPVEPEFTRLVAQAGTLNHPHIVKVIESGAITGWLWYAMDLSAGRSLDAMLATESPLARPDIHHLVEQLAAALDYGHRRNAVHGNLKPSNVLVTEDRWVRLADYGLPSSTVLADPEPARTQPHVAPEVRAGQHPGPAADQYGLALLVYRCLGGQAVSAGADPDAILEAAERLAREHRDLPPPMAAALERALSPRPADRFPSVLAFAGALDARAAANPWSSSFAPSPRVHQAPPVLLIEPETIAGWQRWRRVAAGGVTLAVAALALAGLPGREGEPLSVRQEPSPVPSSPAPTAPAPSPAPPQPDVRPEHPPPPVSTTTPATVAQRPARAAPVPASPPPAPRASPAPPVAQYGRISVSSIPWGTLYIGSWAPGTTPIPDLPIAPGTHRIRVVREGYAPYDAVIHVAPGERVRLTGLKLRRISP